jgi:F0F1-type ATP synthase assembly protein I
MNKKGRGENPWRAAAIFGLAGVDMAICITAGYFLGSWMERALGAGPIMLAVGVLAGLFAGLLNIFFFIKKFLEGQDG